jgi:hypothetical protein
MENDKGERPLVENARARVEQLVADFLADPGGEAAEIARTLLFGCMMKEQTQEEEKALGELQEEKEVRTLLEADVATLAVGNLNAAARNRRLAHKLRRDRKRQEKAHSHLLEVRKVLAEKKPFDYERALKQISAVIGVGREEEFVVHSKVEGTPDYDLTGKEHEEFHQGRGWAWEEEQRRIRERDQKRLLENKGEA